MKKVIDGKLYDTETAFAVTTISYGTPGDFDYYYETLYKKKNGELFLHGEGGANSRYRESCGDNSWISGETIIPESKFNAKEWVADHCDADIYIKLFGPVAE